MPISSAAVLPRVLTASIAEVHGVSRSEWRTAVRKGHWRPMAHGLVLTRPDPPTRLDWAEAGIALAGPRSALSGWDAVRLRGVGDRHAPARPVLVLTREGRGHQVGGVLIRRTDRPFDSSMTPSWDLSLPLAPVVATARAVADHALWLGSVDAVRSPVAQAVERACSFDQLVAELDAGPRQGSGHLRRALADIGEGVRSAAEAVAVDRLRSARVPSFEINVDIVDEHGRLVFVVDILWRRLRAALEIDSREHHYRPLDWERTLRRHNQLTGHRLAVVHRPPREIMGPRRLWVPDTEAWLRSRAAELGVPYDTSGGVIVGGPPMILPGVRRAAS